MYSLVELAIVLILTGRSSTHTHWQIQILLVRRSSIVSVSVCWQLRDQGLYSPRFSERILSSIFLLQNALYSL